MSLAEFEEFVKRHAGQTTNGADWKARKDEWLSNLDRLYAQVERLLKIYLARGDIVARYEPIEINEERLGSYATKRLVLRIGTDEVVFNPVGTLVIGARGRVDMVGSAGDARFLLVPSDDAVGSPSGREGRSKAAKREVSPPGDWDWRIAARPPSTDYADLTAESLTQAIMEVAGG
jgi:hypothetical protein